MKNKSVLFVSLFFILLTWFSRSVPFFWDGTFFSKLSLDFYEKGFNGLVAPENVDTGGFPMYSVYLAMIWKVFGKSLVVSHLALLPFLIGITYEYYKLAKHFLNERMLPFAMFLLIIEPCLITQSILIGYDLLMIYFFLLTLNALLFNKQKQFQFFLVLLCLSNMRGLLVAFSIFIIDLYIHKRIHFLSIKKYFLAITCIISWAIYHQLKTGWFIFNPIRDETHEAIASFSMMLKQLFYCIWKINDFGRIGLWVVCILTFFISIRKATFQTNKTIVALLFIPLLVLIFGMILFSNPIGHKYFIIVFLILNIAFCFVLQQKKRKIISNTTFICCSLLLMGGNLWIYPQKYGNGWDASLKVIPFFELKEEMDKYVVAQGISPLTVGTQFPLIANKLDSHLGENSFQYQNVWAGPIANYQYFLYSNVINTDISEQFDETLKTWKPLKKLRSGLIEISLYENPSFISNPDTH